MDPLADAPTRQIRDRTTPGAAVAAGRRVRAGGRRGGISWWLGWLVSILVLKLAITASAITFGAPPGAPSVQVPLRVASHRSAPQPLSCSRQARSTLGLCRARTDNYKDCWNAPDARRELRTWLAFPQVRAQGAVYRPAPGQPQWPGQVRMRKLWGNPVAPYETVMSARPMRGIQRVDMRLGPPSFLVGPLVQLRRPAAPRRLPAVLRVVLVDAGGREVGATKLLYRYDAGLARRARGHVEHNGPRGRWIVSGRSTPTDWELGGPTSCG